jgi:hypothetical protein
MFDHKNNFLLDFPPENKIIIFNKLNQKDQARLAATCQSLYDFINIIYIKSTYGRMFALCKFMDDRIENLKKSIKQYKDSQRISFFNWKRTPLNNKLELISQYLRMLFVIPALIRIHHYLSQDYPLTFLQYSKTIINLANVIGGYLVVTIIFKI